MKCPVCKEPDLVMSERQGIEIDYCPRCRGVWLDRGELDKIIERSGEQSGVVTPGPAAGTPPPPRSPHDSDYGHYRYKKRRSWLSELFD